LNTRSRNGSWGGAPSRPAQAPTRKGRGPNRDPSEQSARRQTAVRSTLSRLPSLLWNTSFRQLFQENTIRVNLELLWPWSCLACALARHERPLAKGTVRGRNDRLRALGLSQPYTKLTGLALTQTGLCRREPQSTRTTKAHPQLSGRRPQARGGKGGEFLGGWRPKGLKEPTPRAAVNYAMQKYAAPSIEGKLLALSEIAEDGGRCVEQHPVSNRISGLLITHGFSRAP
jgi:hypothetical protein